MAVGQHGFVIALFFCCYHDWGFGPVMSPNFALVISNGSPVRCASRERGEIRFDCHSNRRLGTQSLITLATALLRHRVTTYSFEALRPPAISA